MKKRIAAAAVAGALGIILLASSACSATSAPGPIKQAAATSPAVAWSSQNSSGMLGGGPAPTYTMYAPTPTPAYTLTVPPSTASPPGYNGNISAGGNQSSLPADRMVVRTGNVELVVSDVAKTLDNITAIANDNGGYVVTSQKWKDGERNIGSISIRVLAENYDKAVAAMRGLAMSVISESSSSQDVTQEYTDLDSQLKNLQATEAQLLKIMETATKTEDVLSVQRELTNVQGQIEQAKGRMQYLQRTSSTSLIQVKLNEAVLDIKFNASKVQVNTGDSIQFTSEVSGGFTPYTYLWDFGDGNTSTDKTPNHSYSNSGVYSVVFKVTDDKGYTNTSVRNAYINVIGSWSAGTVAGGAWNGFTTFGRGLVDVLIWLGIFSPIWIIIGGIIVWRVYRKKRKA
jgi:PKD repeat protein